MAVYPVSIKNQSTLYIKATKPAIIAKMKSLGIKNFNIQNAVSKQMLSKVKLTPLNKVKAPSGAGLGKTPGGPNNPGMKISEGASATKGTKKQKTVTKRGGSGNQNVSLSKFKEKLKSKEVKKPSNVRGGSLKAD